MREFYECYEVMTTDDVHESRERNNLDKWYNESATEYLMEKSDEVAEAMREAGFDHLDNNWDQ